MKLSPNIKYFFLVFIFSLNPLLAQVDSLPPEQEFLIPGDSAYFSCPAGTLLFKVTDDSPIDTISSFLTAFIGEVPYVLPEIISSPFDSFYFFALPFSLEEGESVYIDFAPLCDMLRNCGSNSYYFFTDYTPPQIILLSPLTSVLNSRDFLLIMRLFDNLSGFSKDSTYVSISVRGSDVWYLNINASSHHLLWTLDQFTLDIGSLGNLTGGDTITVCINAADRAVGCGANRDDSCFTFTMPYTPPEIVPIFPPNGVIIACPDSIVFRVIDTDSIINVFIVFNTDTYITDSPLISIRGDKFIIRTLGIIEDGIFNTVTVYAEDIYGLYVSKTWGFWSDLKPPEIIRTDPSYGELLVDSIQSIRILLEDNLAGINWGTVTLTVDGASTSFSINSSIGEISFEHTFHVTTTSLDEDSIRICVKARDNPDICSNPLDTCFILKFYFDLRLPEIFPPSNMITACLDQNLIITVFSLSGLFPSTVRLTINLTDIFTLDSANFTLTSHPISPSGFMDTCFFEPEIGYWVDNDTIYCQFQATTRDLRSLSQDWPFYTDFSPPYLIPINPVDSETLFELIDTLIFRFDDLVAGIRIAGFACTVYVNDIPYEVPYSTLLNISKDTFMLPLSNIGVVLSSCDTILICLHSNDKVASEFCGPNTLYEYYSFTIDCTVPSAELLEPNFDVVISCIDQKIKFKLNSDRNLDSNSIIIEIRDTHYFYGDIELSIVRDTLIFTPAILWQNGDTIEGRLLPLIDKTGNSGFEVPFKFVIDVTPPIINPFWPRAGAIISDSLAAIFIEIYDSLSSVSEVGFISTFSSDFSFNVGDTFIFNPRSEGVVLGPEDTIFCGAWAIDNALECGRNTDSIHYWFIVDAIGPRLINIDSVYRYFTSCTLRTIKFYFEDFIGIDRWFVKVVSSHEIDTLTLLSSQLEITDSTITYTPSSPYSDGEIIRIDILHAPDRAGNQCIPESISVEFTVDLQPPVIEIIDPLPGDLIFECSPNVKLVISDSGAGVDWSTCTLRVITPSEDETLTMVSPGVTLALDTINISFSTLGIILAGGDSAIVCVSAQDAIFDTIFSCYPNRKDSCFTFYLESNGPIPLLLSPPESSIISCPDIEIVFLLEDTPGVNWDTLLLSINGTIINQSSPNLRHIISSDSLILSNPFSFSTSDTVTICIIYAEDILDNEMSGTYCWIFFLDTIPPEGNIIYPIVNSRIGTGMPIISILLWDYITDTVIIDSFGIDGIWRSSSSALFWDGDSLAFQPLSELSTGRHRICISIHDLPDICDPNDTIICWEFNVSLDLPLLWKILPDSHPIACERIAALFAVFSTDSLSINLLYVSGTDSVILDSTVISNDTFYIHFSIYSLTDYDTLYATFTASDTLENRDSLVFSFIIDRNPPNILIISPLDSETLVTTYPTIRYNLFDNSGVNPESTLFIINNDTIRYDSVLINWDGSIITLDLSIAGIILPERCWSKITISGVLDSVLSDSLHCGPNYSESQFIHVYIPDDDTIPPEIIGPDVISGWCGFQILPCWMIRDPSDIDTAFLLLSNNSGMYSPETLSLSRKDDSTFCASDSIVLNLDTTWISVCAFDADSETGPGDDRSFICQNPIPIICDNVYFTFGPESLDFGEICVGSTEVRQFYIFNPIEIPLILNLQNNDPTNFNINQNSIITHPSETVWVDIIFEPIDTYEYISSVDIVGYGYFFSVYLKGIGLFCQGNFSVEPTTITPNGDGFYDEVVFIFPNRVDNRVQIFTIDYEPVIEFSTSNAIIIWDGRDKFNELCPAGAYIYLAYDEDQIIGKGLIVVVR